MGHPRLPRIFIVRHGETEWSLNGRHTGTTDIPLTANGEKTIAALGPRVVSVGKPLDPCNLKHVFVSPRKRAQRTFELLFQTAEKKPEFSTEQDVREWDYGDNEGLLTHEIRAKAPGWDIWTDGCPGGESAQEMSDRCDRMIAKIVALQEDHHGKDDSAKDGCVGDVLIVSHGHFTRCFLTRWCKLALTDGRIFVCDAGAMSVCGYQHGRFEERSVLGVNIFGEL